MAPGRPRPPASHPPRERRARLSSRPVVSAKGRFAGARQPVSIRRGSAGPRWQRGALPWWEWRSEAGRGSAETTALGSSRLQDTRCQAPAKTRQDLGLAGWGQGGSLVPFRSPCWWTTVVLTPSPQSPRPALAPGRLCVGRPGGGGAARQLQTVRAKRQVYSRVYSAEGGGRGQGRHTPCQGPICPHLPPAPSSSARGQHGHGLQGLVPEQP